MKKTKLILIEGIDFLKEYADISRDFVKRGIMKTLFIENSKREWELYENQIVEHYNLTRVPDPLISVSELNRYTGIFHNNEMNLKVHIEENGGSLYIFGNRRLKCRRQNTFYLDDISVEVAFIEEAGAFNQLVIGEKDMFVNKHEEGTAFVRVSSATN